MLSGCFLLGKMQPVWINNQHMSSMGNVSWKGFRGDLHLPTTLPHHPKVRLHPPH